MVIIGRLTLAMVLSLAVSTAYASTTVTGSCAGDGALSKQLAELRDKGKTAGQALVAVKRQENGNAGKMARLLWTDENLKEMGPTDIRNLMITKCKEVKEETKVAPLSCTMKREVVTVAAMMRDKGISRAKAEAVFKGPKSDITNDEADAFLKVAYGSMKTVAPEKIGVAIYNLCIQNQRKK